MPSKAQQFRIAFDRQRALRMTCKDADCEAERKGWVMVLDVEGDAKQAEGARRIERDSGRKFVKLDPLHALDWLTANGADHGITVTPELHNLIAATPSGRVMFLFPPGQACFRQHLDREVVFVHQKGSDKRIHARPTDFNEHFNIEADKINRLIKAG